MPRITEIKPTKRGGRILIKLDDGDMFRVSKEVFLESGLAIGDGLSQGEVAAFRQSSGTPADAAAAEILSRRPYSKSEIAGKLAERGYSESEIAEALDKLEGLGILNDLEYARMLAEFCEGKNMSIRAFKEELYRRKVEREVSEIVISEFGPPDAAINALISQKLGSKPLTRENLSKTANFLRSRGFDYADIKRGLRRLSEEIIDEEGDASLE